MSASRNTNSSISNNTPACTLKHQITFSENPRPRQQKLNKSYDNSLPENKTYKVCESIPVKSPPNIANGRRSDMGFRTIGHNQSQIDNPVAGMNKSMM